MSYRLTRSARLDMLRIWSYIANDSEDAADRFFVLLKEHFQLLGRNPRIGRPRDELRAGYRSFAVGHYVIFYRMQEKGVEIMHVLHGKRDLDSLFE